MLQEILKQATHKNHDDLEQLMFVDQIMDGTLTLDQYKKILSTNYIIHTCFEQQIFDCLDLDLKLELDIYNRTKLPALLKDLEELNIDPSQFNYPKAKLGFTNYAAALGALYVMEGATLGGNVIVKKLKVNANLQPYNLNFYYYQVYGAGLIANWKQFCQILNSKIPENEYDNSINGALMLFDYFALAQQKNSAKQSIPQI